MRYNYHDSEQNKTYTLYVSIDTNEFEFLTKSKDDIDDFITKFKEKYSIK